MTDGADLMEQVILVDENDQETGRCGKLVAHAQSRLHRAFSIFLVDAAGRLLLQRRSLGKYHSGGLWANACCGHPRPGEATADAATRRLREELGVTTALDHRFVSRYRAPVAPDLEENEIVHVYFGAAPRSLEPNPAEVMDIRLLSAGDITEQLQTGGPDFASWFRHYMRNDQDKIGAAIALAMKPVP